MKHIKMFHRAVRLFRALGGGCAAALFSSSAVWGSNVTNVNVGDNFFSPRSVTISVSDQVKWTWIGMVQHSSTSDTGLWNSGLQGNGATFIHTFNSAGSFPYHCTVHSGQLGTVTVQALAGTPPTVTISSPTNGTVLSAPASFVIAASATDPGGNVTSVEFFQGAASLGMVTTSPYLKSVNDLPAGNYAFSAVATGTGGLKATNSISLNVVTPVPSMLSAPMRISNTTFQFGYSATPGLTYVVQRSTDLLTWTGIKTNVAASNPVAFQDNGASGNAAYYRVAILPNP